MKHTILLALAVGCAPSIEEGAFEGPGFDSETGELTVGGDELLVALTHLQVKNAPGPGGRFGDHAQGIGEWLYTEEPEGWVGAAFRNEGRLNWWTMTVWESEEAMLAFVTSDIHGAAMADLTDISVGAESRSDWMPREDLPLAWTDALDHLREAPGFQYGESTWFGEAP
ncbi:MAG: hypothetical protein R3F61_32405 [Myxococcota bacterium]